MDNRSRHSQKWILCVDDDRDTIDLFKLYLHDYQVLPARTMAEALSLVKVCCFDLYLLDNWLPDGTGIDLCSHIRQFDPNTPIIFVSAVTSDEDRQTAMSAGAQAYFVKPVEFSAVARAIVLLNRESEVKSFEAKCEELAVMREELMLQRRQVDVFRAEAADKKAQAVERLLRIKARMAFIAAGGTRANFERMWPELSLDATSSHTAKQSSE